MSDKWEDAEKMEDALAKLKTEQRKFLTKYGWIEICDSPGSYWLWSKEFNGKRFTANTAEFAVQLELNEAN